MTVVVLAAQGVDAAAGDAHVAQQHLQVGAAHDVGHAGLVLGDAHGVEQRARAILGQHAGGNLDVSRGYAGDLAGHLRRVLGHDCRQLLEALGALGDEGVVLPALADDDVHQAVEQSDVCTGAVAQVEVGDLGDVDLARVGHDQFGPALAFGAADLAADDGMLLGGVAADDEDRAAVVGDVADAVGHRPAAEAGRQTGDGAAVSETGAVVDAVGGHQLAGQLGEEEVLFV